MFSAEYLTTSLYEILNENHLLKNNFFFTIFRINIYEMCIIISSMFEEYNSQFVAKYIGSINIQHSYCCCQLPIRRYIKTLENIYSFDFNLKHSKADLRNGNCYHLKDMKH